MDGNKKGNLPKEITESKRFFTVTIDTTGRKKPTVSEWQNPANQTTIDKIQGMVGFDITGHGQGADYLFVDFDNVLDDKGNFINETAEQYFNYLEAAETYCEKSISGHGLHFFFKPTPKLFQNVKFTGGNNGSIFLDDKNDKIKIEVFYRQNRYCLLTGDIYSGTSTVVDGEAADEIFQNLINAIAAQNPPTDTADLPQADFSLAEAKKALFSIPCKKVDRNTWAQIGMALKDTYADDGFTLWNQWSKTDPDRYSLDACQYQWSKFCINKSIVKPVTIATLIYHAKKCGYKPPRRKQSDEVVFDTEFTAKLADWEEDNGAIAPDVKAKLKKAKAWLDALTQETITSTNAQSSKTKHAIALCKFYDCFADAADKFLATLDNAKSKATAEIKKAEALNTDAPIELQMLLQVSVRNLKADVNKIITEIKKAHAQFRVDEEARLALERNKQRQAEREAQYKSDEELLAKLKAEPQTPERDEKIREVIRNMCDWKHDKLGNPVEIRPTIANIDRIFPNDPNLDGLIGYDEFQQADVFLKAPVWNKDARKGDEFRDRDDDQLQLYICRNYAELTNEKLIRKAIVSYSDAHKFHKVKDYFKKLPKWDGIKRAQELLIKFLGADDTPYVRAVTLNWLIAAIARIFHAGCRYQTALVLHGAQGIGKSFLLEQLGGEWYDTLIDNVDDAHAIDAIQKMWLVEIKEMASMRKADINAQKRFLDGSKDTRRPAYGRYAVSVPRHCVFAITVNDEKFLNDKTGNRRYLIVHCKNEAGHYVEGFTNEFIQQVWAEVYQLYQEMFAEKFDERKLELPQEIRMQAEEITKQHVNDDGLDGTIEAFVNSKIPPLPIWNLLSREERAEFHKTGCIKLLDAQCDLNHRLRAKGGRNVQDKINELDNIFRHSKNLYVTYEVKRGMQDILEYWIYGTEYREHICAAEIFTECFGNDKRKSMTRLHEVLSQLKGWTKGKTIKRDPAYGDQKTVYYRDNNNYPDNNNSTTTEPPHD